MDEQAKPQAGSGQVKKPKARSRKRRVIIAAMFLLAVGFGGWAIYEYATRKTYIDLDLGNNQKMRLVLVPAGTFLMGSPENEAGRADDEGPQHEVTISRPFYMGICEVTQEQYFTVMGLTPNESYDDLTWPMNCVTWDEATEFCRRLSDRTGRRVMLPTEAQWEYACRAGTTTPFSTGQTITEDQAKGGAALPTPATRGWFAGWLAKLFPEEQRRDRMLSPVGSYKPNAFGLYDMHGNIEEWCADWYDAEYYARSPKIDPPGPPIGQERVVRSGAYLTARRSASRASRGSGGSDVRESYCSSLGFRVVVAAD